MALNTKSMNNYVDLIRLKAEKILQNKDFGITLNDDIWEQSTLLVKSGGYLTEDLINKLLNFGIKKVQVNFVKKEEEQTLEEQDFLGDFVKTQNALILENNLLNASGLVKKLVDMGFNKSNIFITANHNSINKYFRAKKINFVFTGLPFYKKCARCVNKYSLLRNTHAFVLIERHDSMRKVENNYASDVKFLRKPVNFKFLKILINKALNYNLQDFYAEEADIS